jgi:DNA-binding protein HU-beta
VPATTIYEAEGSVCLFGVAADPLYKSDNKNNYCRVTWERDFPCAKSAVQCQRLYASVSTDQLQGGTRVNKSELIEVAAKEAAISKAAAEKALSSIIGAVVKAVSKGDSVTLVGFGTFKAAKRAARTGVNPKTGEKLKIAATTVPRFTAGAAFKASVAGKKAAKKK